MPLKDPEKRKTYQATAYLKNREAYLTYASSYYAKHRMDYNPTLLLAAAKYILGTDSVDHYDDSCLLDVPERIGHGISA